MLAAGAKVAYEKEKGAGWLCLVVVMSSAATVYQLYWDFVKDWGLLEMNSKNPWLRKELMLRRKIIYYLSMVYAVALPFLSLLANFSKILCPMSHWHGTVATSNQLVYVKIMKIRHYEVDNEHILNENADNAVLQLKLRFSI